MDAYIYQSELLCEDCARTVRRELLPRLLDLDPDFDDDSERDSEGWPVGPYGEGGGESDSPEHCGGCGAHLENPLTREGEAQLLRWLAQGPRTPEHAQYLDELADVYGIDCVPWEWNRFDIASGWYWALTECHRGQNSPEYARLCRLQRRYRPGHREIPASLGENARAVYIQASRKLLNKGN